jgi:hypothetical protein
MIPYVWSHFSGPIKGRKKMRVPFPKPFPVTDRARVLREIAAIEAMLVHVRTKQPPRATHGPNWASKEMQSDLRLCEAMESAASLGRQLADRMAQPRADFYRPSRDVLAFLDLAYAVKRDFFQKMEEADDGFPL